MSMFKKTRTGNGHKLKQYDYRKNDSECAFFGFVPECDLCEQSGTAATGQCQQMQHDFRNAGVIMDRPVLVESVRHKGRQIDADEVGIKKTNLQKMR